MGQVVTAKVGGWAEILYSVAGVITPYTIPVSIPFNSTAQGAILSYTNGTAAGQIDTIHALPYTLVSTTQTIDVTSLLDVNGVSVNFARIREIFLYNTDAVAGHDFSMYQGVSNGLAILPPSTAPAFARANGGFIRISDPNSTGGGNGNVTSGASKTIKLDSGSHTVTAWLVLLGGSAA